jgi:hypothetical protein
VKFYLDEHIPKAVAEGLRRRGIDVLTIQDAETGKGDVDENRNLVKRVRFERSRGQVLFLGKKVTWNQAWS